jgi:hypothetical protein
MPLTVAPQSQICVWQRPDQRQKTLRLPDELAEQAEVVERVQGKSVTTLIVDSLASEIERVRSDKSFTSRAEKLLERDKELLERLAR